MGHVSLLFAVWAANRPSYRSGSDGGGGGTYVLGGDCDVLGAIPAGNGAGGGGATGGEAVWYTDGAGWAGCTGCTGG